jgi:hypothetical protein
MDIKVAQGSERTYFEVDVVIDGKPGRVMYEFLDKEKTVAQVSYDMGKTWVSVGVVHAALMEFLDKYPFVVQSE